MRRYQALPPILLRASFFFFFLLALGKISAADNSTSRYVPRDNILVNCGLSGSIKDTDGRTWTGDIDSKYASSITGTALTAPSQDSSVPQVPYLTARVFTSPYTYTFPLGAGRKFVRLYFYPSNYSSHAASDAFFTVTAGSSTLLKNFSAYLTTDALNFAYLIREYSVSVPSSGLNITFTPSTEHHNSYAFVNGIEIVSAPDEIFTAPTAPLLVGTSTQYDMDPNVSLETVYRLNVGGQAISPSQDSGLFRSWADDTLYIFGAGFGVTYSNDSNVTIQYSDKTPEYIAPADVYSTARSMGPDARINLNYNLTWILQVDAGFYYLVRFHFCEIQYPITKPNQRVFDIYLYNLTAQDGADVIAWSGGIGIPVYEDYVVITSGTGLIDLWVALHPDTASKPEYYDAILNGLEVFKLQKSDGTLAGPNPEPLPQPDVDLSKAFHRGNGKPKIKIAAIAGGVIGGFVLLLAACFCLFRMCRRQKKKRGKDAGTSEGPSAWLPLFLYGNSHSATSAKTNTTGSYASSLPSNLCRHFSFAEIEAATNGFDEALLLGVGGFGKVYRGEIDGGSTKVAIKRGNPMSEQGVHEFQTEIEMLSKLRHRHLVSLIGYCEENCEMILVYDYMAHGTLREHLYKTPKPPLPWKQRLEICIGAALSPPTCSKPSDLRLVPRVLPRTLSHLLRRPASSAACRFPQLPSTVGLLAASPCVGGDRRGDHRVAGHRHLLVAPAPLQDRRPLQPLPPATDGGCGSTRRRRRRVGGGLELEEAPVHVVVTLLPENCAVEPRRPSSYPASGSQRRLPGGLGHEAVKVLAILGVGGGGGVLPSVLVHGSEHRRPFPQMLLMVLSTDGGISATAGARRAGVRRRRRRGGWGVDRERV